MHAEYIYIRILAYLENTLKLIFDHLCYFDRNPFCWQLVHCLKMSSGPPLKKLKQAVLNFNQTRVTRDKPPPYANTVKELTGGYTGYTIVPVPSDGDCMFSAIAHQLSINSFGCGKPGKQPASAPEIRMELVEYIRANPSMTADIAPAGWHSVVGLFFITYWLSTLQYCIL